MQGPWAEPNPPACPGCPEQAGAPLPTEATSPLLGINGDNMHPSDSAPLLLQAGHWGQVPRQPARGEEDPSPAWRRHWQDAGQCSWMGSEGTRRLVRGPSTKTDGTKPPARPQRCRPATCRKEARVTAPPRGWQWEQGGTCRHSLHHWLPRRLRGPGWG